MTVTETADRLPDRLGGLPRATTLGRLLSRIDGDALDDAIGIWLARHAADPVEDDQPLVGLAVDGKTVRGSRNGGQNAVHLLAAVLHESQAVISQRQIAAKSNEIPAFAPLLDRLHLHGHVITADAMHTQTDHAEQITARGAHYILVVKGNQKKLRRQLRRLPWREVPLQHRTHERAHGRGEIRRLKGCTVQPGLLFPHAVQAIEVKRRRTNRTTSKTTTKTIYAVTSLTPEQATASQLAELIRGHWQVEALHHVRDVTFAEDASPRPHRNRAPRDGNLPQPRHRPHPPGRLDEHRRRHRPLPVTGRPRTPTTRSRNLRTHQPWGLRHSHGPGRVRQDGHSDRRQRGRPVGGAGSEAHRGGADHPHGRPHFSHRPEP
ncbi:ISAs1 family transposase [Streptomyces sp. NPDC088353]|uniref:ISAs1 family transposase n=1 Tax=Streptomyces sp. NPDC088353 TaxID=3365855 RepID=UPI003817760C